MTGGETGALGLWGGCGLALVAGLPGPVAIALGVGGLAWVSLASARPDLGLFGCPVTRVERGIALTIDDGPEPSTTPMLLEVLKESGVHATFFFLADRAAKHPELVAATVAAGHEIGLHGLTHSACLTWRAPADGARWLQAGVEGLRAAGAGPIRWFRPPFGVVSPRLFEAARRAGLEVAWVSLRSGDGIRVSEAVLRQRLAGAGPGDIVLVHDGNPTTVAVLLGVIRGWSPNVVGTLSELAP